MTIVSSLKKLFKKMTGKDATGGTIDEIINELSVEYEPGEGGGGESHDVEIVLAIGNMEYSAKDEAYTYVGNSTPELNSLFRQYVAGDTVTVDGEVATMESGPSFIANLADGGALYVNYGDNYIFNAATDKSNKEVVVIIHKEGSSEPSEKQVIVATLRENIDNDNKFFELDDYTESELIAAFDNQIPVYILVNENTLVPVLSVDNEDGSISAGFSVQFEGILLTWIVIYKNGTWTADLKQDAINAPLIVHGTVVGTSATITDDDITLSDIATAAENGRTVYFDAQPEAGGTERYTLNGYADDGNAAVVTFMSIGLMDDDQDVTRIAATFILFGPSMLSGVVFKKLVENV